MQTPASPLLLLAVLTAEAGRSLKTSALAFLATDDSIYPACEPPALDHLKLNAALAHYHTAALESESLETFVQSPTF